MQVGGGYGLDLCLEATADAWRDDRLEWQRV